jgi:hypothetical protein
LSEQPRPDLIMQVGLGFWASKILLSAVEMEVFTDLAKGPLSLESLHGRLGLHPRAARDFLDALVALGFLLPTEGVMPTHRPPRNSSTSTNPPTSEACSKWRTAVSMNIGAICRKRCEPAYCKTRRAAETKHRSPLSMPMENQQLTDFRERKPYSFVSDCVIWHSRSAIFETEPVHNAGIEPVYAWPAVEPVARIRRNTSFTRGADEDWNEAVIAIAMD